MNRIAQLQASLTLTWMLQEITQKEKNKDYSRSLTQLVDEFLLTYPEEAEKIQRNTLKTYLSKYMTGRAVPSQKNLHLWLQLLTQTIGLTYSSIIDEHLIRWEIPDSDEIIVDATALLFDTRKLGIVAHLMMENDWFSNLKAKPTLILTVETDGLPFAYAAAFMLGVPCLYARKRKPAGITEVLSVDLDTTMSRTVTLYVPKKLLRKDKVLIVDDVVRSGRTQRKLVELVAVGGAETVGLLSMIGIGNRWHHLKNLDIPLEILYVIS
ncbi:MAG: phosphoribosyltransferase family protein [Candidatus Hodarchaeota archaeon]